MDCKSFLEVVPVLERVKICVSNRTIAQGQVCHLGLELPNCILDKEVKIVFLTETDEGNGKSEPCIGICLEA